MTYQVTENTTQSHEFDAETVSPTFQNARKLGLALLAVLSFKVFLALNIGPEVYQAAIADLASGDLAARAVAHMMMLDGLSLTVIDALN